MGESDAWECRKLAHDRQKPPTNYRVLGMIAGVFLGYPISYLFQQGIVRLLVSFGSYLGGALDVLSDRSLAPPGPADHAGLRASGRGSRPVRQLQAREREEARVALARPPASRHPVGQGAFCVITFLHIIFGELAPKLLAIRPRSLWINRT